LVVELRRPSTEWASATPIAVPSGRRTVWTWLSRNHLGTAHRRAGRYAEAVGLYRTALDLFGPDGDPARVAATASNLSIVLHLLGRHDEAIAQALHAVRVQQTIRGPGEAALQTNLGRIYARIGRHTEAVEHSERALHLHRKDGSRIGEAIVLGTLCVSYAELGRYPAAVEAGRRAVGIGRRAANPEVEAMAFNSLGEAFALAGRHRAAERRFRRALAIVGDRGDADERARALAGLGRCRASGTELGGE
jgi:tetratricopeptide (TPR) repeat protein